MKIKDIPKDELPNGEQPNGIRFKHPKSAEICFWVMWFNKSDHLDNKGVLFYKTDPLSTKVYPMFLDSIEEALEFEVVK